MGRMKTTGISHNKNPKHIKPPKETQHWKVYTQSQCSSQSMKTFSETSTAKEGYLSASQMVWHIHFYSLYLVLFITVT